MKSVDDIINMVPTDTFRQNEKFKAKLTFAERCEILAFYRMGLSRIALANAYGIDRRTVTHMYTKTSRHYQDIRNEEEKLGREEFCKEYITEAGAMRIATANGGEKEYEDPNASKKAASKFAGLNMVKTENTSYEHRIIIEWQNEGHCGAGWYYRDLDGNSPNDWFHNGPESVRTSSECLKAVKLNLFDM